METTNWFAYTDFYEFHFDALNPGNRQVNPRNDLCEYGNSILFHRKGIYIIAESTPEAQQILFEEIKYIGHAGGVGANSYFDDRIRKHGLKALGCHIQNGVNNGINAAVLWQEYVQIRGSKRRTPTLHRLVTHHGAWNTPSAALSGMQLRVRQLQDHDDSR